MYLQKNICGKDVEWQRSLEINFIIQNDIKAMKLLTSLEIK